MIDTHELKKTGKVKQKRTDSYSITKICFLIKGNESYVKLCSIKKLD